MLKFLLRAVEQASEGIAIADLNGTLKYLNKAFASKHGYKQENLLGKNLSIFHTQEQMKSVEKSNQIIQTEGEFYGEIWHKRKDGTIFPTLMHNSLILDDNGNKMGMIGTFVDITEQKKLGQKLRESEKLFRSVFETAEDCIFIKNRSLQYIQVNKTMEKLFDMPATELLDKSDVDLFGEEAGKHVIEVDQRVIQGEIIEEEYTKPIQGVTHTFHTIKIPLKDSKGIIYGLCGIARDITELKKAEQKLKESEQNFRKAYHQVNFYKDLFTHDINNVLNNISIAMKLCTEKVDNHEKISDYLNLANESINRGKTLVSNVRKLSQLEDGEVLLEPMEPLGVLKETIEFVKKSFQTKEINIDVDLKNTPVMIYGNELLSDIFENILINAINHNMNPIIDIIIRVSKRKRKTVNFIKFEFVDNGIGITDERKKEIFEGEYRRDRETKGMGFGLSLVKKIITSYNGFIWVENRIKGDYSQGSNFIILIPEAK